MSSTAIAPMPSRVLLLWTGVREASRAAKGSVYRRALSALPRSSESEIVGLAGEEDEGWRRRRLVILGTGWGSYSVLKKVDKKQFDVIVISPRNHFLFTPLLASTTVGTLEFRSIIEPVRSAFILKALYTILIYLLIKGSGYIS